MKQGLNFHIFEAWLSAVSILVHHVALLKFFFGNISFFLKKVLITLYSEDLQQSNILSILLQYTQSHVPAIKEKCKVKYQVQQAQNQQQPYNQQTDNEK